MYGVSWSPSGLHVALCTVDKAVHVWKAKKPEEVFQTFKNMPKVCYVTAFSDDGKWFGCGGGGGDGGYVHIYAAKQGWEEAKASEADKYHFAATIRLKLKSFVYAFAFIPDCDTHRKFVHGGGDCAVTVRDLDSGSVLQKFKSDYKVFSQPIFHICYAISIRFPFH